MAKYLYEKFPVAKYKTPTMVVLLVVALFTNIILADLYLLPHNTVRDQLTAYSVMTQTRSSKVGRSTSFIGYHFFTQNGFEFSTEETFIDTNRVLIEHTLVFKNVIGVKTDNRDYTVRLISGLNGINAYFYLILAFSSTLSLLLLWFQKNISENGFLNILLFNAMMLFFIGLIYINT